MPVSRDEDFFFLNTSSFPPNYLFLGRDVKEFTISLVKIGTSVSEKTMDVPPRTTYDDGRQPIAIGHLIDLDDLKTVLQLCPQHVLICDLINENL